ncbi:MAG TPA: hypothetical protein VGM77_02945 [Gemmatimonadales bacterium]|jgi:hypothetical protein
MDGQSVWLVVLASAGVAAMISAAATFVNSMVERKARQRELFLSKAVDLAVARSEMALALWKATPDAATLTVQDDIVSAEAYFEWLEQLWKDGKLPPNAKVERL